MHMRGRPKGTRNRAATHGLIRAREFMDALHRDMRPTPAARGVADRWGVVESTVFRDVARHIQRIAEETKSQYVALLSATIDARQVEIGFQTLSDLCEAFVSVFADAWLQTIEGEHDEARIRLMGHKALESSVNQLADQIRNHPAIPSPLADAFIDGLLERKE